MRKHRKVNDNYLLANKKLRWEASMINYIEDSGNKSEENLGLELLRLKRAQLRLQLLKAVSSKLTKERSSLLMEKSNLSTKLSASSWVKSQQDASDFNCDDDGGDSDDDDNDVGDNDGDSGDEEKENNDDCGDDVGDDNDGDDIIAVIDDNDEEDDYDDEDGKSDSDYSCEDPIESCKDKHLPIDDLDEDDGLTWARPCFPCPFCYVDIEILVLCSHLQDEHCFDLKNAVCPLCAANLGKDVIGHFMVQHASSLKHKRKTKKSGLSTGNSAMLGKELSSFLGYNSRANINESAPDTLLSPFLANVFCSDPIGSQQDESSNKSSSLTSLMRSTEITSAGGSEVDYEERNNRTAFVQELVASMIL